MKRSKKNIVRFFPILILLFFTTSAFAEEKEELNIKELIFEHLGDSYKWHFFEWNGKDVSLHLPVILLDKNGGWHLFSSSRLEDNAVYEGFYIANEGQNKSKIVEKDETGAEIRPWNFSITKNVLALFISVFIISASIMSLAKWYKNDKRNPPSGFLGFIEMIILNIQDEVIKPSIGEDYKRFSPFLLTAFFFILTNNLLGLIPIFPGGANVTGNITITLFLSFITFLLINVNGNKHYWKEVFWPDVPTWLKVPFPLMPLIEIWGIIMKPAALMIRLFANVMAGHSMVLGLISLIFVSVSMGVAANIGMSTVAVLFSIFISLLEVLVSVIQAYIFVLLSSVFIGMSRMKEKIKEENYIEHH
ncbi:F0F1 ATP synthase subunit A [Massilibacteroides sp.]|uniref:F0F1 ATP synthase subunit A n=1 Tax=Massilibacteroides sp. TaxID=2034766 RepID=UPI0026258EE4|nr:F0F1 ATP synthase subunit A [Massilibacteroides sp.]MDD4516058.1 F0F1 ATP synthase subunit A [Massilibacteroides sp.]